ncbi:MAG TPA: cytochrome c [Thermoflexus sp.]|nr:cytochrome c [Thermoflexus sp.]
MRLRRIGLVFLLVLGAGIWLTVNPPRPILNLLKRVDPSPETGALLVERYGCRRCHRIGDRGGILAPDLNGITRRVDDPAHVVLRLWLRDPQSIQPGTAMPNFRLSDSEIEAILMYLKTLDAQNP